MGGCTVERGGGSQGRGTAVPGPPLPVSEFHTSTPSGPRAGPAANLPSSAAPPRVEITIKGLQLQHPNAFTLKVTFETHLVAKRDQNGCEPSYGCCPSSYALAAKIVTCLITGCYWQPLGQVVHTTYTLSPSKVKEVWKRSWCKSSG